MSEESDPHQGNIPRKQGLYDPQFEHDACGTGFVVNIKGNPSHAIVEQALTILENLAHRGATGCEANTGDGAGILVQMPHAFLVKKCATLGFDLPGPRYYGVGMLFMPTDEALRQDFEQRVEQIALEEGQRVLGWRTVPTDGSTSAPPPRAPAGGPPGVHRAQPADQRPHVLRAQAVCDPQARRTGHPLFRPGRRRAVLCLQPVLQDPDL